MKQFAIILIMLLASVVHATDRYVDSDRADDSGDGITREAAKKTIDAAYALIADGDTVWIMESTAGYDEASQGNDWQVDIDRASINCTIAPDSQNVGDVTFEFGEGTSGIKIDIDTITVEFQDLIFDGSAGGTYVFYRLANQTANATFTDCTIHNSGSAATYLIFANAGTVDGDLIFDGCTITSDNYTFYLLGADIVRITDCIITSADDQMFRSSSSQELNTLIIEDSTLTQTGTNTDYIIHFSSGIILRSRIENCTITSNDIGIKINGGGSEEIAVIDNTIIGNGASALKTLQIGWEYTDLTTWDTGQDISAGDLRYYEGEVYENHQAINPTAADDEPGTGVNWRQYWFVKSIGLVVVSGNHVTFTNADLAHSIFIGYGADNAEVTNNFAYNGNYQLVVKAKGCSIRNNILVGRNPLHVFAGFGNHVINNTLYSTFGSALYLDDQDGTHTKQDVVLNNICDASGGGSYAMVVTDATLGVTHYVDYNFYVTGSSDTANLGGTDVTSVNDMTTRWQAWASLWNINDENSIVGSPLFMSAGGEEAADYRLQDGSPCLNVGKATPGGGYKTIGAWGPYDTVPAFLIGI